MNKIAFYFIGIIFAVVAPCYSKDWNGIVPCKSSRADVEKILGKDALLSPDQFGRYRYKDSRVYVDYVKEGKDSPLNDVVESIHVYPDASTSIALKKFIKSIPNFNQNFSRLEFSDRTTHIYGQAVYRNMKAGFEIWVQKDEHDREVISRFGYFDPEEKC
jgi:hypothetical protein